MHFVQYVDNLAKISDDLNAISIIISELNNISNDIYIGGKEYKKKYQEAMQK